MAKRALVTNYFGEEFAKANSDAHGTLCDDVSLTRQSEREDADINTIVKRFGIGHVMPRDLPPLMYGDFTHITDYQSAFDAVADAQARFMQLEASVRERFANDPQRFLEFCETPGHADELKKLGLMVPEPEKKEPVEVIVKNASTEPPRVVVTAAAPAQ